MAGLEPFIAENWRPTQAKIIRQLVQRINSLEEELCLIHSQLRSGELNRYDLIKRAVVEVLNGNPMRITFDVINNQDLTKTVTPTAGDAAEDEENATLTAGVISKREEGRERLENKEIKLHSAEKHGKHDEPTTSSQEFPGLTINPKHSSASSNRNLVTGEPTTSPSEHMSNFIKPNPSSAPAPSNRNSDFTPPTFPTSASAPPPVKKIRVDLPPPSPPLPVQTHKQSQQILSPILNRTRLTPSSDEDEDGNETQGPDEFPPTPPPPQRASASVSIRHQKPSFSSNHSTRDNFDKIPIPQSKEPNFAYKPEKVVRKKEERKKLPGWDCPTCRNYYEAMASQMEPREIEKLRNKCSKHRSKLPEPDFLGNTPRYFWDLDFPSTQECLDRGLIKIGERSQRK